MKNATYISLSLIYIYSFVNSIFIYSELILVLVGKSITQFQWQLIVSKLFFNANHYI